MSFVGTEQYAAEIWDEKITDALNYLFILSAIIKEEKRDQKN